MQPIRISVITPSLNQAAFIEATIRSVLDQDYAALDYIVIDGGSTDGTLAKLRGFGNRLRWVSEPDHGQSDAINKGMLMASGDVMAYLNADDLYLPGTLERVANYLATHPEAEWVYGHCQVIDETGAFMGKLNAPPFNLRRMIQRAEFLPQPAVFWRRSAATVVGEFDARLHYAMDYDYFIRLAKQSPGHRLDADLACFRFQPTSKTITSEEEHWREALMVSERHGLEFWMPWYWIRRTRHHALRALPGPMQQLIFRKLRRVQNLYQRKLK
ncbi:MAG: glycosyltransferase [Chloroflexi bacterium]|nr:glycosyltransferase [Chloroflexota bacterium]